MRLIVLILVSLIAHSSGDVLQVKCGDENCERPSNKAVTTLRYAPDKPYKVRISAVNSEVEIFGMTDDLYYIRYGKTFGFIPKNHLREKARGNYPFSVEIDLGNKRIDQTVREMNFLHEFLKLGPTVPVNENTQASNVSEPAPVNEPNQETLPAPVNEPSQENQIPTKPIVNDIPLDGNSAENKTETDSVQKVQEVRAEEDEDNDSGIDDEDDEDDEEGEEDEEDSVEEKALNSESQKINENQPELVAIPPSKDSEAIKVEEKPQEKVEEAPKALPVAASAPEEPLKSSEPKNFTAEEPKKEEKPTETVPEFIPIKEEVAQAAEKLAEPQVETFNVTETIPTTDSHNHGHEHHDHDHHHEVPVNVVPVVPVIPVVAVVPVVPVIPVVPVVPVEDIKKPEETAPTPEPEKLIEEPFVNTTDSKPSQQLEPTFDEKVNETLPKVPLNDVPLTDVPQKVEATEIIVEETTLKPEEPQVLETTTSPPPKEILSQPEIPSTEAPQELPPDTTTQVPVEPVEKVISNPDALLQKFNEKLGRSSENTGRGSVEPLHPHHGHDHSHGHDHHQHDHKEEIPSENVAPIVTEGEAVEKEEKPGFFAGLFQKFTFFSDKDDSEQHFQDLPKDENAFNPTVGPVDGDYCEKIDSEDCPKSFTTKRDLDSAKVVTSEWKSVDEYLRIMLNEAIEMMDLIISMGLTALTVLIFTLGYYCISKAKKEGPLIAKMNELERHLMSSTKENEMLKGDVIATKQKLMSIEDNSFGSNDMVIALKKDLEMSEAIKTEMSEKIVGLEKELEAAAEDGLELNRMVSELLSNQTGSESIISSVEDLQRQLNEQQETIITMNETLAAKSRENSELQIQLSEINGKFKGDFQNIQHQIDALTLERNNLQIELENVKRESDYQVNQLIEERNNEVQRLNHELTSYSGNYEEAKKSLIVSDARVQALEECMKAVKKDSKGVEFKDLFDIADLKADLLAVTKEKSTIQEQFQVEKDSRKLLEDRVKSISDEMSNLKKEFGVAEKEKLEAQTRLEVLSTYFKDKEVTLQQELSLKEARWMKQQGETTSTVEKVQALNDEIQGLKSQNDSLRAEIEAQMAAHKLNISLLEGQSHGAWLNARQAERKLEESRMESAALRRRLTSIAENPAGASDLLNGLPGMINDSMNTMPSPIRVESPNNTNSLPPAPLMMPPFPQGFLQGAGPPFLPPLPFMPPPPGEMGLPLGRLMSPPPKRFTPTMRDDRDRYSPRGRGRYTPDSRYDDYTAFETETDYSPPPSPSPPRRGYNSPSDRSKKSKGGHSSAGSIESNPTSRRK